MNKHSTLVNNQETNANKAISLFTFIRELNQLKQQSITNITEYPWTLALSHLPQDTDNISLAYQDTENDDIDSENYINSTLLSVHKPDFQKCPAPDNIFVDWLLPGWDIFDNDVIIQNSLEIQPSDKNNNSTGLANIKIEKFVDNPTRLAAYKKWLALRKRWASKQKILKQTRDLFTALYRIYFELQKDSETKELIVANGIICSADNPNIKHPVLTHRVKIDYIPTQNTICIVDTEYSSELYSSIFQNISGINLSSINERSEYLQQNDCHPLNKKDTPEFLKILAHKLSSKSLFSDNGIPDNWEANNKLLIYWEPYFILRKRLDGTVKAINQILENINATGEVPAPICNIVSGGTIELSEDKKKESIAEQLAAVGGESVDILLSKAANKEQLEIARRIEQYNAVIVQGPPGTGKTHTIANLMGHFLAQGKSILVTSHTIKALSVLKEKLSPGLQNLCVSLLDDSNVDMEKSIDGIASYMSSTTAERQKEELSVLSIERNKIIDQLANVRQKIFAIINRECNCIVYNGESISPSNAAKFITDNITELDYIPGTVRLNEPLPLTIAQFSELYQSNNTLSLDDEEELSYNLPEPSQLVAPEVFATAMATLQQFQLEARQLAETSHWKITNNYETKKIHFSCESKNFEIPYPNHKDIENLSNYAKSFGKIAAWAKTAMVDGKKGGAFRQRWLMLIEQINKTCEYAEIVIGKQFGKTIVFKNSPNIDELKKALESFKKSAVMRFFQTLLHSNYKTILENVEINGHSIQNAQDCDLVLDTIKLNESRNQCAIYWDELLAPHGIPKFSELDTDNQEQTAANLIPDINRYLDWYQHDYRPLLTNLTTININTDTLFKITAVDSDITSTDKIIDGIEKTIPQLCSIVNIILTAEKYLIDIKNTQNLLIGEKKKSSIVCTALLKAISEKNSLAYSEAFDKLEQIYTKYNIQNSRRSLLNELSNIAPDWAKAIENRSGIHGGNTLPPNLEAAWKWKQLNGILTDIIAQPFAQLQADSMRLSKVYRQITATYAEKSGWYHLLKRTETNIDLKQNLQGWKQTIKKIGKGTGKRAAQYKEIARQKMVHCQKAVPGWIMTINKALECLNPKENRFDIVIIDEASQSDISSLAILYMGKKLIIVGDDKQVSPMAIGIENESMDTLIQMYIKDKIPNSHLYTATTSIYDIASTTFQSLMLREHFRCVPEIIGFSNMLSYDYKIKPLRDTSNSVLTPAVINYRVANGQRLDTEKVNPAEAQSIVALLQSCIEQPEYAGKTFGIISLLGDEQSNLIQHLIEEQIDAQEVISRHILCGNAANFQGDERDVIFLSVVDSNNGSGPIRKQGYGANDAYRKRYNVAASRAKDQLWVVNSLDAANDLKSGDIRKILLDYATNPNSAELTHAEIEAQSDSPFETSVVQALTNLGYKLVQQWKVGAYRLDIVAMYDKKTVAIECDGERWHSGEAKVREDMERQTILERLGWRFIRIRGSEYFRNPDKTISHVVEMLENYGIKPTSSNISLQETKPTELLNRVKNRAAKILSGKHEKITPAKNNIIAEALNEQNSFIENPAGDLFVVPKQSHAKNIATEINTAPTEQENHPTLSPTKNKRTTKTETTPNTDSIIELLEKNNVSYIDKRNMNGALWIIGGFELKNIVQEAKPLGITFRFKKTGGRLTNNQPAWWGK